MGRFKPLDNENSSQKWEVNVKVELGRPTGMAARGTSTMPTDDGGW